MKLGTPQYITNSKGKRLFAVIPVKEYERLLEKLEDLADAKAYDKMKSKNEKIMPFETFLKQRKIKPGK